MRSVLVSLMFVVAVCSDVVFAQPETPFEVLQPEHGKVFAWSRTRPDIHIEVRIPVLSAEHRSFVTANIYDPAGNVVDRVALYDDGSHGDSQPGDGIFTGTYSPQRTGDYVLKARWQWTDPASGNPRERWTSAYSFAVEAVPYPRIISPTPGQRVGSRVKVTVRMLAGEEMRPYDPQGDETIRVRAWAEPSAKAVVPDRSGGEFTATLELPKPGGYRLFVTTAVLRRGQWIEAEPESVQVQYNRPSTWPFWIGGLLLVVGVLLPGKKVPLYRHSLRLRRADGFTQTAEITPQLLQTVRKTVGGQGCDIKLSGVEGMLFTLVAEPGVKALRVEPGEVKDLSKEIRPLQGEVALRFNDWALEYEGVHRAGETRQLWKQFTPVKWVLVGLAVLVLLYGGWTWWQFQRLTTL
ncbi:MAG: hypothetical protein HPY54_06425 [Chthonomonadetes bacterium]|nr:hypothetical protein [Chthonomonadetes bacterium]